MSENPENNTSGTHLKRKTYVVLGFVFVGLGFLGIFLPLLPTTPFLLLAAYFFARGSKRWEQWLENHSILGPYVRAFREGKGLTTMQKWRIMGAVTLLLGLSFWLVPQRIHQIFLGVLWVGIFYYIMSRPTRKRTDSP